jgi:peptidoglycan hydrolase-like protein with peptidoglycan-binding domain
MHAKLGDAARRRRPAPLRKSPPLLRLGSEGWHVKRLQRMLRARGLYPEPAKIDGDFGEITEAGVKAFQEFADLVPDGIVGPLTWRALAAADVKLPVAAGARLQPA